MIYKSNIAKKQIPLLEKNNDDKRDSLHDKIEEHLAYCFFNLIFQVSVTMDCFSYFSQMITITEGFKKNSPPPPKKIIIKKDNKM